MGWVARGILISVAGLIGLFVALMLTIFVFSERDAYGTLGLPGSGSFHFPAGKVHVNYQEHSGQSKLNAPDGLVVNVRDAASGEPVRFEIDPGATSNTTHVSRVGLGSFEVPEDGDYTVAAAAPQLGNGPELTFGKGFWSTFTHGTPLIIVLGSLALIVLGIVVSRRPDEKPPVLPSESSP
jgi:hypothetical protein